MIKKNSIYLYVFLIAILLVFGLACGSGGSDGIASTSIVGTGNGGTKVKVSGSIDAFGSLFVGGIKFDTIDPLLNIEGVSGNLTDLELGMWVEIEGTVDSNTLLGTATNITYNSHQSGFIDSIGSDNTFQINDIVITTDVKTYLSLDLVSREILTGMNVSVTGTYLNNGQFKATYIGPNETGLEFETLEEDFIYEFDEDFDILSFQIELEEQISGEVYEAEGLLFDFSQGMDVFESGSVAVGDFVIVTGEIENDILVVSQYALLDEEDLEFDDLEGEAEGILTELDDDRIVVDGEDYFINAYTYFEDESEFEFRQFGPDDLNIGDYLILFYLEGDEGENIVDYVIREDEED